MPFFESSALIARVSSAPCSARIWPRRFASGVGAVDVVDHQRFGGRLDEVDHVVQARCQLVDVLAVERSHEDVLQLGADLAVDVVALLLECLNAVHALVQPVEAVKHLGQLARPPQPGSRRRR